MMKKALDRLEVYMVKVEVFVETGIFLPEVAEQELEKLHKDFREFLHKAHFFGVITGKEYEQGQSDCAGLVAKYKRRIREAKA